MRQALALLRRPEYRHLYAGILCTIDVRNDPIAVYEALLAEAPPRLDLLLPHATWDHPPYRPPGSPTPYADWLGRIHARWLADGRPLPIRFFDSLLAAWEGHPSGSEAAGLDPVDLLVIETDGSWEQADSLKTAFDGARRPASTSSPTRSTRPRRTRAWPSARPASRRCARRAVSARWSGPAEAAYMRTDTSPKMALIIRRFTAMISRS